MAFDDGIKVGPVAYIGLVSVIVLFALVLALQVVYYRQSDSMRRADLAAEGPPHELAELTAKQQTALMQRGYVKREQGIVSIGIERAKELVIAELAADKNPSDVTGPKRPIGPPAKPTGSLAKPAAKTSADKSSATAEDSAKQETPIKKAAAAEPKKEKQEPKDDKKS